MTECTTPLPLEFKSPKRVCADFSGGDLSSDGGLLLVRQADESLNLSALIASCIEDPRDQDLITHPLEELIRQRVLQIVAGYEDVNDANSLRTDPVLKTVCGRDPGEDQALGSASTLSRLENWTKKKDVSRIKSGFVDLFLSQLDAPQEIVLDIDGYADPTHGQQEFSFYHGYYKHHMYHPILINDAATGFPLVALLRPGNSHAGKGVKGVLRWLFWRIRKQFPNTRIVLRGDGGFSLPEIMAICERSAVTYVLGFSRNAVLERKNEYFLEQARVDFVRTGIKARNFNDVYYQAGSWDSPRRIIMKAEWLEQGSNQRFVVTNAFDNPQELYDDFYVMRGEDSENRIKEFKLDVQADRLSCHAFLANQFRLLLHQAAFILLLRIRAAAEGTALATARLGRIRELLVKVAAKVKASVRRIHIQMPTSYPLQQIFRLLCFRLQT